MSDFWRPRRDDDTSTHRRTCRRMEQLLHGCGAADASPTHTPLHPHSSGIRIVLLDIGGGVRSVSQDAVTHATRVSAFGSMRQSVTARSYTCSRIAEVYSCSLLAQRQYIGLYCVLAHGVYTSPRIDHTAPVLPCWKEVTDIG